MRRNELNVNFRWILNLQLRDDFTCLRQWNRMAGGCFHLLSPDSYGSVSFNCLSRSSSSRNEALSSVGMLLRFRNATWSLPCVAAPCEPARTASNAASISSHFRLLQELAFEASPWSVACFCFAASRHESLLLLRKLLTLSVISESVAFGLRPLSWRLVLSSSLLRFSASISKHRNNFSRDSWFAGLVFIAFSSFLQRFGAGVVGCERSEFHLEFSFEFINAFGRNSRQFFNLGGLGEVVFASIEEVR